MKRVYLGNKELATVVDYKQGNSTDTATTQTLKSLIDRSITNITIPNGIIKIGESAFENCTSLTSITIPNGITTIGESAFENCTSLTSVTIPSSTTWIGQSIFNGCTSLSNIIYQGTMAQWNHVKFHGSWHDGVPSTTVVTCSDGTVKL